MSVSLNEGLERLLDNNTCKEQKRKQKKLFKEESVGEDVARYQKWVDYDMKRYGEVSEKTKDSLEKAGLSLVKDQYGEYEVIADEKIHESCNCKKRFLKEGTSNFYSMSNFPLLIFGDDEDVYDRVWDMTKEELGGKVDDDEIDQTEEFENNWKTYFDYCTLSSEEQSELQDELKEINDKLETLRYTKEDELESDFEIAKIEIRPGYYEALQLFVPDEKYLEDWQIDAINDALEGLKKEYGLTELGVAYRASNGETGYKKVESVEECNLNEAKLVDRKTFGGIHNIFGKKVWVTGELSDTRDYRWEDVRIEDASGDLLGFGRYKWLNRPWQRFTYDVAFTKAVRDAFGDTAAKKADEAVENSSSIEGALKYLEEHEEKDECLTEDSEKTKDKLVIYKSTSDDTYYVTPKSNYNTFISDARKIHAFDKNGGFESSQDIIDMYVKYGIAKPEDFEVIDECLTEDTIEFNGEPVRVNGKHARSIKFSGKPARVRIYYSNMFGICEEQYTYDEYVRNREAIHKELFKSDDDPMDLDVQFFDKDGYLVGKYMVDSPTLNRLESCKDNLTEMTDDEMDVAVKAHWDGIRKRTGKDRPTSADFTDDEKKFSKEISCIRMINSVLAYLDRGEMGRTGVKITDSAEEILDAELSRRHSYLKDFVDELGRGRVIELIKGQQDDIETVEKDTFWDDESGSYNTIRFKKKNESVISDRIRKGDLDYNAETDAYYAIDGDTKVDFQDRETRETRLKGEKDKWGNLRITGREDRQPRVSSHTIARIWKKDKDGKVTFDRVEGPKYLVRQDVARMFDKDESLTEADVTDQVIIDTHKDGFITKKAELRDKGYKTLWVGNGKICMYKPKEAVTEAHKEQADEDAVRELVLYAENDSRIYRNKTLPVIANLKRKVAKGVFDKELAVKAFQYVADDAAKQYKKEFPAEDDGTYNYNFNPATREEVARQLLDRYMEQIEEK